VALLGSDVVRAVEGVKQALVTTGGRVHGAMAEEEEDAKSVIWGGLHVLIVKATDRWSTTSNSQSHL